MTNPPPPEIGPMLFADCPFCDALALVDATSGALSCEPCALTLTLDDEPVRIELAVAA